MSGLPVTVPSPYCYSSWICGLSPVPEAFLASDGARIEEIRIEALGVSYCSGRSPSDSLKNIVDGLRTSIVPERLETIADPSAAEIQVIHGDGRRDRFPLLLLPPWTWSLDRDSRLLAATFVVPGNEELLGVLAAARARFGSAGDKTLLRMETIDVLAALHATLREDREIEYADPTLGEDPTTGFRYQRVLAPLEVLNGNPGNGGNCIDLTLVLAGCLETLGHQPLLLFTGDSREEPDHAFLGVWDRRGARFRPLLEDPSRVQQEVDSGRLLVLESTSVCRGEHGASFETGRASATARVHEAQGVHAVDVSAARPPMGRMQSVQPAQDPVVRRAMLGSVEFAATRGAPRQETIHLLHGLARSSGPLSEALLGDTLQVVADLVDRNVPHLRASGIPRPTPNLRVCLETARRLATSRGSGTMSEGDLLLAILQNPSRNIRRILSAAGRDPDDLQRQVQAAVGDTDAGSMSRNWE